MALPTNLESLPSWWDEDYYLQNNSDVAIAVKFGLLKSGFAHFVYYGAKEGRDPNPSFNTQYYLSQYPDVVEAIRNGAIDSAFEHWLLSGQLESRQTIPEEIITRQKFLLNNQEATNLSIPLITQVASAAPQK